MRNVDPPPIYPIDKTSRFVAVATDTAMIQNDNQSESSSEGMVINSAIRVRWFEIAAVLPCTVDGCGFQVVEFPWITLSSTDLHVLESTNQ